MSRYIRQKNDLIVIEKRFTKNKKQEMKEREELLSKNRNGVFGSIY